MEVERRGDERGGPGMPDQAGRRAFLRIGASCAIPLLVGELSGEAGGAAALAREQSWADPVLDHIRQELVRTYHAVRGAAAARGEQVRAVAVNLDLMGAYLQSKKYGERADAAIRRRIEETGREATVRDLMAAYGELAAENSLQYGVASRVGEDLRGVGVALDAVTSRGVVASLRGPKVALSRLAALFDRADLIRGRRPVLAAVGQKPGDDFLGYPPIPYDDVTWCEFLTNVVRAVQTTAAILGVLGFGVAAGGLAVAVEILELMRMSACKDAAQT